MSGISKIIKSSSHDRISIKRRKVSKNDSLVLKEALNPLHALKPPGLKIHLKNTSYERKPLITMPLSTTHQKNSSFASNLMTRKRLINITGTPSNNSIINFTTPNKVNKIDFPMKPKEALVLYSHELTGYEQAEILDYSEVYYLGNKACKIIPKLELCNFGFDDMMANMKIAKGDHIAFRYEVLGLLGKGSFGQVCECFDHKRSEKVALKIIRNKKRFYQQAGIEVSILTRLRDKDHNDSKPVIKMKNYFIFRKHVCITFDLWNHNLYELLKGNRFQGLSISLIRRFTIQILSGLSYLSSLKIIHCDLKPENILLKHPTKSDIVIIDFGSATFDHEKIHTYIQSRFYRAPEVILGIPYTTAIDMWSLGCILAELVLGKPLFPGESEHDQLVLITEYFGLPDSNLLMHSSKKELFFDGKVLKDASVKGVVKVPGSKKIADILRVDDGELLDFISKCLDINPSTRLTPQLAVNHPWIKGCYKGVKIQSSIRNMDRKYSKVKIIVN